METFQQTGLRASFDVGCSVPWACPDLLGLPGFTEKGSDAIWCRRSGAGGNSATPGKRPGASSPGLSQTLLRVLWPTFRPHVSILPCRATHT